MNLQREKTQLVRIILNEINVSKLYLKFKHGRVVYHLVVQMEEVVEASHQRQFIVTLKSNARS